MHERSRETETRDLEDTLAALYRDHDRLRLLYRDTPREVVADYLELDRLYLVEIRRLETMLRRNDLLLPFPERENRCMGNHMQRATG
jgi:hypothetical protein